LMKWRLFDLLCHPDQFKLVHSSHQLTFSLKTQTEKFKIPYLNLHTIYILRLRESPIERLFVQQY
jgi:hypothetical protein